MSKRIVTISATLLLLLLLVGGVLIFSYPTAIQWRTQFIILKLQGSFPDLSWYEIVVLLQPGQPHLDANRLLRTKNPYAAITNPYTAEADIAAGAKLFRSQCALCHGLEGTGGSAPDLTIGTFRHGSSDLALFRTISRGITGSVMEGLTLPQESIWKVVAFLRSLSRSSDQTNLGRGVAEGDSIDTMIPALQVSYARLLRANEEPGNWLTYSGTYQSHRYSRLNQINRNNVQKLKLKWLFQMSTIERKVEATPLVVENVMYVTEPPNDVIALETETGRRIWSYTRTLPEQMPLCCGRVNRGLAVLEDSLYLGTLDSRLVALDAKTGAVIWDVEVADYRAGYSITVAPLAVKDKIIVGIAGGEFGIRGFLDAYDAESGERLWRFYTIPGPGETGHETWSGDSWKTGGAPTWLTGSFDPELNLIYWGVGNPGPNFQGDVRKGDNLYSNCVVALDADNGKLKWYFQFTPHDEHDWDAAQIPVLVDAEFGGERRKLMLWANRNAFYYVLDRETGEFLLAREFAKQTWAKGIDSRGRPIVIPESAPSREGTLVYPGLGGTNWWSPAYNPLTGLLYVPVWERGYIFFKGGPIDFVPGEVFMGSATTARSESGADKGRTAVRALVALTGELKWEYTLSDTFPLGGILSTGGNLVFGGGIDQFFALDAHTGDELWQVNTGGKVIAAPITYLSQGKQQVTIAAGRAVLTFGLGE